MDKYITNIANYKGYKILCTQEWIEILKGGHYHKIVFNKNGHIIHVTGSCCGVPKGKITKNSLLGDLKEYLRIK